MRKNKALLICLVALLLVCVCTLGLVFISSSSKSNYEEEIENAAEYFQNGDYENAIKQYEEILKEDDTNIEAYKGIANALKEQGKYSKAIEWLASGIEKTQNAELEEMKKTFENLMNGDEGETYELTDVVAASNDVTLYSDMLSYVDTCTYGQYSATYTFSDDSTATEKIVNEIPITLYFESEPTESDKPVSVKFRSMTYLFNGFSKGVSYDKLQTLGLEDLTFGYNDTLSCNAVSFSSNDCTVYVECDENGNIIKSKPANMVYLLSVPLTESEEPETVSVAETSETDEASLRTFKGYIKNATNDQPAGEIHMKIYEGKEADKGDLYLDTYSNSGGDFKVSLPYGTYNVELSGDGYITEVVEFEVSQNDKVTETDFLISPEMEGEAIRIVLTWGSSPRDIDSHLTGTSGSGQSVNVWYGNKTSTDSDGSVVATLDIDETQGNGVETTTIYDTAGSYTYYVHNFSGEAPLTGSDAQIKVYEGSTLTQTLDIPTEGYSTGDDWYVLKINNGKVSIVNEYK